MISTLVTLENVELNNVSINDIDFLYELRSEYVNYINSVSGNEKLPTYQQHTEFVKKFINHDNHPYLKWYVILWKGAKVGVIPLKKNNEFGYQVKQKFQGMNICQTAFNLFFKIHPINSVWARTKPNNIRSQHLLKKLGFVLSDYEFHFQQNNFQVG